MTTTFGKIKRNEQALLENGKLFLKAKKNLEEYIDKSENLILIDLYVKLWRILIDANEYPAR